MAKNKIKLTPSGRALHAYVGKPDAKFNPDNPTFKLKLVLSGEALEKMKAEVDAAVDEAYEKHVAALPVAQKRLWTKAYPYEDILDDEGNPTGEVAFKFRQNAKIKRKDGTTTEVKILVVDSKKNKTNVPVFTGATVRVGYTFRSDKDGTIFPSTIAASKIVSVRMDLAQVQLIKPAPRGDGVAFDEVEDGWVDDHSDDDAPFDQAPNNSAASTDGDF